MADNRIKIKDGRYSREITVEFDDGECDVCHQPQRIMIVDASEGEYGTLDICRACVNKMFDASPA